MKTLIYKLYVLALMAFVVWSAQFIYSLIFWEFELKGEDNVVNVTKTDKPLVRQKKMRDYMDNHTRTKKLDLGDVLIEEQYESNHFHHVGQTLVEPVLNGCDYCHTNLAHAGDRETRAFLNQHGYFVACETCHYNTKAAQTLTHYWIKVRTEETIVRPLALIQQSLSEKKNLQKAKGNYGARIAPWIVVNNSEESVISLSSIAEAKYLLENSESMKESQVKGRLLRIHKNMRKDPVECDACHEKNNAVISYEKLGYSKERIRRLVDTAIVGMISKYKQFHFPNLFIRKDDREGTNQL